MAQRQGSGPSGREADRHGVRNGREAGSASGEPPSRCCWSITARRGRRAPSWGNITARSRAALFHHHGFRLDVGRRCSTETRGSRRDPRRERLLRGQLPCRFPGSLPSGSFPGVRTAGELASDRAVGPTAGKPAPAASGTAGKRAQQQGSRYPPRPERQASDPNGREAAPHRVRNGREVGPAAGKPLPTASGTTYRELRREAGRTPAVETAR